MASILIIDDHKIFSSALMSYLTNSGHSVITAENGKEGLNILETTKVDIILLDISMPVMNGMEFMEHFRKSKEPAHVIVLTQHDDQSLIIHMLSYGVNGFLLKNCELAELEQAITETMKDGEYLNDTVCDLLARYYHKKELFANLELSKRECELLTHITRGRSSKEIAAAMNLSLLTIESYRKAIMKKTQARNVASLVKIAIQTGLIRV